MSCCGTCSGFTTSPGWRTGRSCRWTRSRSGSSRSASSTGIPRWTGRRSPAAATTATPDRSRWCADRRGGEPGIPGAGSTRRSAHPSFGAGGVVAGERAQPVLVPPFDHHGRRLVPGDVEGDGEHAAVVDVLATRFGAPVADRIQGEDLTVPVRQRVPDLLGSGREHQATARLADGDRAEVVVLV